MDAAHMAALREGRERKLAQARAERQRAHQAFSHWIKRDARLWRNLKAAMSAGEGVDEARGEWASNLAEMPSIAWAGGDES